MYEYREAKLYPRPREWRVVLRKPGGRVYREAKLFSGARDKG